MSNASMIDRMQKLQNRAMRIILKRDRYTPIKIMLDKLNWLSVYQRLIYKTILYVFKIKYKLVPQYLVRNLIYVGDSQPYELRNMDNFRLPAVNRCSAQNQIMYKGLKLFNEMPSFIKLESRIKHFSNHIIKYVKEKF